MVSLIFVIFSGISSAMLDACLFHEFLKGNKFFDPSISWMNKWKPNKAGEERFFGSSTFLAWTTDGFHLFKTIMLLCFAFAIVLYKPILGIIDVVFYHIAFGLTFELFFSKVFVIKK